MIFIFISSCSSRKKDEIYLERAIQYEQTAIDSCFWELKQIQSPQKLNPKSRADYGLLLTKCQIIKKVELSSDTLLSYAINYYRSVADTSRLLSALYWSAMKKRISGNEEKALADLLEAESLAVQYHAVPDLAGIWRLLGFIYMDTKRHKEAIHAFQQAMQYSEQAGYNNYWVYNWDIGSAYRADEEYENAILSLEKLLKQADSIFIKTHSSRIYIQLTDLCMKQEDYKRASHYVGLSKNYRTNRNEAPIYNLTKGQLFMETQQYDSARIYLMKAIQSPNPFASVQGYSTLTKLENILGNSHDFYLSKINEEESFSGLYSHLSSEELRKQYQDEKLKNENNLLKLAKNEREIYLLILGMILLFLLVLFFIFYSHFKKKKVRLQFQAEEQALKDKALILEKQNMLLQQAQELSALHEKAAILRASVFRKMSIAEKIPSLDSLNEENGSVSKKISLTEKDWNELIRTVDEAYPEFIPELQNRYPELNKEDLCFCCLVKIHVSLQDLSDIYCISKAGISKKKIRMKKEKLGITDENTSLDDFLQYF